MISVLIPIRIVSVANKREHWAVRHKRAKAHRMAAIMVPKAELPCTVKLTRVAPGNAGVMDGDNLQMGFKGLRDGIAARLGVDDADPRIRWEYAQEKGVWGARVEIFNP